MLENILEPMREKAEPKECKFCFNEHPHTDDECWDKNFTIPNILYISCCLGEWTHPLAESFLLDPDYPLEGNTIDKEDIDYTTVTGNILRFSFKVGDELILMVLGLPYEGDFENIMNGMRCEEHCIDEHNHSCQFLIDHILYYALSKETEDYKVGIKEFRHTDYGRKFLEMYNVDDIDYEWIYLSPDVCLHYDVDTSAFEGIST